MPAKKPNGRMRKNAAAHPDWPPGWSEELEREFQASRESFRPHVYDKADWHTEGKFPKRLPKKQAFVHTGFFTGWLIAHRMIRRAFVCEWSGDLASAVKRFDRRALTGPEIYEQWGGVLASDMLTDTGNKFAQAYYDSDQFGKDYRELLVRRLPSFYHVQDTWTNYEAIASRIDSRYQAWRRKKAKS